MFARLCSALTALVALFVAQAQAAELSVVVRDGAGQPVRDAVVILTPVGGAPKPSAAGTYVMAQTNVQFQPFVLVVPNGATVALPNRDKVRHHVYSFSPAKKFELKLYGKDESRTVKFDNAGVVALGCNIHDQMEAYIKVVDTPWAAKTDAAGRAVLSDAPAGAATLTVWHPYQKARNGETSQTLTLTAAGASRTVAIALRAGGRAH